MRSIADSLPGASNARCQPPLEAGATQERTLEAVGCTPLFGQATGDPALRLFGGARLDEMLIEGKGPLDAQLLHDKEGDAIREGGIFVLMPLEGCPPCIKERRLDVDELHGWAPQQVVPYLEGLRMLSPTVEKRHDFVEDVGGRDEAWQRRHDTLPVPSGHLMMLVIGNFQC
jgi:hypothetical protein